MVIGLLLINGEGTKILKKLVHLGLQFLAICLSLIGMWAALKFHNDKGIDNFYSLHSWLDLACISLFGIQSTGGIMKLCFFIGQTHP
ncbi:Transmembrane ascorbate ferrireductase 2 [Linum perenne]